MYSSHIGTFRSTQPLQGYALTSATHHQTWHTAPNHSPQSLQTLSCLSRVLSVNWLSSAKRSGSRWQICQVSCSPGRPSPRVPERVPTSRCQALLPPLLSWFQMVWAETCTEVLCQRLLSGGLAVLLIFSVTV